MDYRLQYNLSGLPEDIQKQVKDFIEFLLSKRNLPREDKKRVFGRAKGKIRLSADFDEPLDDFKA